jgi:hypothetical protein
MADGPATQRPAREWVGIGGPRRKSDLLPSANLRAGAGAVR